jgi:hypothetical protein
LARVQVKNFLAKAESNWVNTLLTTKNSLAKAESNRVNTLLTTLSHLTKSRLALLLERTLGESTPYYKISIEEWDVKTDCPSAESDTPANREALALEFSMRFTAEQQFNPAITVRVSMRFFVFYWLLAFSLNTIA